MIPDKDQRQWAKEPRKSLAERRAEELEVICKTIDERPRAPEVQDDEGSYGRLRTLCSLTPGTESLKEYIQGLLKSNPLKGLPELLRVRVEEKQFGIFDLPIAQKFERFQILIKQPAEMERALRSGDEKMAMELHLRIEKWKEQFERLYEESVDRGANIKEVVHQLKRLNESEEKEE